MIERTIGHFPTRQSYPDLSRTQFSCLACAKECPIHTLGPDSEDDCSMLKNGVSGCDRSHHAIESSKNGRGKARSRRLLLHFSRVSVHDQPKTACKSHDHRVRFGCAGRPRARSASLVRVRGSD